MRAVTDTELAEIEHRLALRMIEEAYSAILIDG
jgi:hypothetical protein